MADDNPKQSGFLGVSIRKFLLLLIAAVLGPIILLILALFCSFYWVNWDEWQFEKAVHVGMTVKQVEEAVGPPGMVLKPGEELRAWGDSDSRIVTEVTWVYRFGFSGVHRYALTIRDGVVVKIDYDVT